MPEPLESYKAAVGIRGDCLYCPLPLSIDSYFNCEPACRHCYLRRLNRTWGMDLRPSDPDQVRKKLEAGLKNPDPKTSLAWALKLKKTIRLGNKSDPFQPAERQYGRSGRIIAHLNEMRWSYVIQSKFLANLLPIWGMLEDSHSKELLTLMPEISPGAEWDWEVLEKGLTTPIEERFRIIKKAIRRGWNVGVNGEPFIPGLHTIEQFRDMCKRLKAAGVESYNTYNLHFNDWNAKEMHEVGIDIERIWYYNQDARWRAIQQNLCLIARQVGIRLGCPDFVNTGPEWEEKANTCCGINVPNPSRFNAHFWKSRLQQGWGPEQVLADTWEGIGEYSQGDAIVHGKKSDFYTMKDVGL